VAVGFSGARVSAAAKAPAARSTENRRGGPLERIVIPPGEPVGLSVWIRSNGLVRLVLRAGFEELLTGVFDPAHLQAAYSELLAVVQPDSISVRRRNEAGWEVLHG
ncbi:MAG: hypothetical protein ACRD13_01905, partial [Terriglobales bacterium]